MQELKNRHPRRSRLVRRVYRALRVYRLIVVGRFQSEWVSEFIELCRLMIKDEGSLSIVWLIAELLLSILPAFMRRVGGPPKGTGGKKKEIAKD